MTKITPTWAALLDIMLSNGGAEDVMTSEAVGWLGAMARVADMTVEATARVADANVVASDIKPVHWNSDDEVLALLRDLASGAVNAKFTTLQWYRGRAAEVLRD